MSEVIRKERNMNLIFKILSKGIEIWIKKQCISINNINIQINGSILEAIKGTILEVNLEANEVNFKDIHFNHLFLISGPIQFNPSLFKTNKELVINRKFDLKGQLILCENDLNQTINSKSWLWVKNWLSKNLIEGSVISEINLTEEDLLINTDNKRYQFNIKVYNNTLAFEDKQGGEILSLPMDPSIRIESLEIKSKKLNVNFNSIVKL